MVGLSGFYTSTSYKCSSFACTSFIRLQCCRKENNHYFVMASPSSIHLVFLITDRVFNDSGNHVTSTNFDDDSSDVKKQVILTVFLIFILSSIAIAGIFGNSLIVIAVCRTRTLRSVTDYFICSLASADLFVSFFIMPFAIVTEILEGTWLFGETFCSIWSSLDILCCTASIWNLCAISIDRYIAILKPLIYKEIVTPRKCAAGIAIVWTLSSLLAFSQLFWKYLISEELPNMCIYAPDKSFRIYATLTAFFIPMSITLAIYCRIMPVAFKQARKIGNAEFNVKRSPSNRSPSQTSNQILNVIQDKNRTNHGENIQMSRSRDALYSLSSINQNFATMTNTSKIDSANGSPDLGTRAKRSVKIRKFLPRRHDSELSESMSTTSSIHESSLRGGASTSTLRKSRNKEWKIIKTLVMVVGIFFICWMPFAVVIAIEPFLKNPVSVQMMSVFLWLGYFNSVSNPVIYVWLNRNYRRAFKRVLFGRQHSQNSG